MILRGEAKVSFILGNDSRREWGSEGLTLLGTRLRVFDCAIRVLLGRVVLARGRAAADWVPARLLLLSSREPGKEEECCCYSRVVDRRGSWLVGLHSQLLQTVLGLRRGRPGSCGSKSGEQVLLRVQVRVQVVVMAQGERWTGKREGGWPAYKGLYSESTCWFKNTL